MMSEIKELEIDEHILDFRGKVNLPRPLKENHNYVINTEISVEEIADKNKHNGKKDRIYKAKSTGIVAIKAEKETEAMLAKRVITSSQKARFAIECYHDKHLGEPGYDFINSDKEEFYNNTIKLFMGKLENIIRLIYT